MLSISFPTQKGQGLVEYALIMVLVSVVVIGALTVVGPQVGNVFSEIIDIFPGAASPAEPIPAPTEEPFGYLSPSEAKNAFCATYLGTDHMHVHYNETTGRYIGWTNLVAIPAGFTFGSTQLYCP